MFNTAPDARLEQQLTANVRVNAIVWSWATWINSNCKERCRGHAKAAYRTEYRETSREQYDLKHGKDEEAEEQVESWETEAHEGERRLERYGMAKTAEVASFEETAWMTTRQCTGSKGRIHVFDGPVFANQKKNIIKGFVQVSPSFDNIFQFFCKKNT